MRARNNLPLLIRNRNLSVRKLSEVTGIHRCYVGWIAQGRMVPTDEELERICRVLKVTADMVYPDPEILRVLAE